MKIEIEITKKGTSFLENDNKIVEICVCNGHWKYIDDMMETDTKIPLTINTVHQTSYATVPVKDVIPHYNHELFRKERKLEVIDASIRTYDTLIEYLSCRAENLKEDYKKYGFTEDEWTAILFKQVYIKSREDTVVRNIEYQEDGLIEIKMRVVE